MWVTVTQAGIALWAGSRLGRARPAWAPSHRGAALGPTMPIVAAEPVRAQDFPARATVTPGLRLQILEFSHSWRRPGPAPAGCRNHRWPSQPES